MSTVEVSLCMLLLRCVISCMSCMQLFRCVLMFATSSGNSGVLSFMLLLGCVCAGGGVCGCQLCSACAMTTKMLWSECGPDGSVVAVAISVYLGCGVLVSMSSILHSVFACPCCLWMYVCCLCLGSQATGRSPHSVTICLCILSCCRWRTGCPSCVVLSPGSSAALKSPRIMVVCLWLTLVM